ncbi:D-Ala-D-Ala carboxypeptidase family metallohydrolase [Microbulbifer bruguierae]|uniref:D-Ala-D-Ala carboxypeptidase family metallohydrolase n=1 Tax=Microbulbifer bruguierae TaxID=3029061 RepID=A0ABY8NHY1_9GAMM|nr:D-Ala-D-Ala carboxypeptidase family metallohydrolase [Microbulbifer bruguierae]WGL18518.1 D-Ala-D-Ala carboxypeptidase family metallohydrolase [Microbulbifer bruguierae]
MPSGNPFFRAKRRYQHLSPNQQTNWWVVFGVALLLLLLLFGLWLYLLYKAREKPYDELHGYRIATKASLSQFLREGTNRHQLGQLTGFLREAGVADATEVEHLLRQGTDWLDINEPPFAIPPKDFWPNMVPTLKLIRDELVPAIGPVDIVSAFRSDRYNRKAGGSKRSKHRSFCGLDLVPRSNISRKELIEELRNLQARLGPDSRMGLGIYSGVRFHVDTCGFRHW